MEGGSARIPPRLHYFLMEKAPGRKSSDEHGRRLPLDVGALAVEDGVLVQDDQSRILDFDDFKRARRRPS